MNLIFHCEDTEGFDKLKESLDNSEFYSNFQFGYKSCFYFEVQSENDANALELEIQKIVDKRNISGHFELED
jgi:hypothetical protein